MVDQERNLSPRLVKLRFDFFEAKRRDLLLGNHVGPWRGKWTITLPETNSSHLKMDGWNTSFLLGWPIFRCYVSFRLFKHHPWVTLQGLPPQRCPFYNAWLGSIYPPQRMPVTTRIITFLVGNRNQNLHLPLKSWVGLDSNHSSPKPLWFLLDS